MYNEMRVLLKQEKVCLKQIDLNTNNISNYTYCIYGYYRYIYRMSGINRTFCVQVERIYII